VTSVRSARSYFDEVRPFLGSVPSVHEEFTCKLCVGPVNIGFEYCFACSKLVAQVPEDLLTRIVPVTSALKPGPWYGRLREYKISRPEYMTTLAAVLHLYLSTHSDHVVDLLGGSPTRIGVVPSTRGYQPVEQPLYRALDRSSLVRPLLAVLQIHSTQAVGRWEYMPDAFPATGRLARERIILVEDTWVTGAKSVSAAGALMEAGASVAVIVIGREVNAGYTDEDHPYRAAMARPYDITSWPR
jgi:hypothetical protein